MKYHVWVVDERDKDSKEPLSSVGVYYSEERALFELQEYLRYAKENGMIIVKFGVDKEN